jgi:hypothetical protein
MQNKIKKIKELVLELFIAEFIIPSSFLQDEKFSLMNSKLQERINQDSVLGLKYITAVYILPAEEYNVLRVFVDVFQKIRLHYKR